MQSPPATSSESESQNSGPPNHTTRHMAAMQNQIGNYNDDDMLKCPDVWKFIKDYSPTNVISVEKLRDWGRTLVTDLTLNFEDNFESLAVNDSIEVDEEPERESRNAHNHNPKLHNGLVKTPNQTQYFDECVKLCDKLKTCCTKDGLRCDNDIRTVANGTLISETTESKFMIDGCFVKDASMGQSGTVVELAATDILVVFECKQGSSFDDVLKNRLKVVSVVGYILLDDARRKFMYAINVEGQWMTLWYFAHDHCVRTTFNWWKDKATMISVFLSFMYATEEDLGFDPRIHLLPASKNRRELASRFIYELEDDTQIKHFYRSEKYIVEPSDMRIVGRNTRVFKVVKVESESDDADYKDRPRKVLKDTWMNAESNTESEIQKAMFADIHQFINSSVVHQHKRLSAWVKDGELFPDLEHYLGKEGKSASRDFRELFLCVQLESTGGPLKAIHAEYLHVPDRNTFYAKSWRTSNAPFVSNSRLTSIPTPSTSVHSRSNLAHRYPTKKRTFMIFNDFCRPINALPTVGAAFEVLKRTVLALLLMYCANWVHRDISAGNVMARWNAATKRWESKLGDLEYARLFIGKSESDNRKVGTAYFMPAEVICGSYFPAEDIVDGATRVARYLELIERQNFPPTLPAKKVIHNFNHDVESVFWIAYWIVTCRVGHQPSRQFVARIFLNSMKANDYRNRAFSERMSREFQATLHPRLQHLVPVFEQLRYALWALTCRRNRDEAAGNTFCYSQSHFAAFIYLDKMCDTDKDWYGVLLEKSQSARVSIPETLTSEIDVAKSGPVSVSGDREPESRVPKRGREQDEGDEGNTVKRRSKAKDAVSALSLASDVDPFVAPLAGTSVIDF